MSYVVHPNYGCGVPGGKYIHMVRTPSGAGRLFAGVDALNAYLTGKEWRWAI